MRWALAIALLLLAACNGTVAPWTEAPPVAIDLKITVSAERAALLQPVTVHLDRFRRPDLEVDFAPVIDAADFLAETKVEPEVAFGAGRWQRTTIVLRPVRGPGELVLPSFVAKAKDGTVAASTPETKLVVESSIGDHGAALEAPGDPFAARPRTLLWLGIAGLALLLLAGGFLLLRRRSRLPAPGAIAVPAHTKALRALARLRNAGRTTPAQIEAYYVEVSNVLRTYLEERFGLRAPECTTEEFLRELEGGDQLAREHRAELERFLSQCDLVKFAAVVPTENDHLATFALAEAFVERTRPDRAGPEVAS